MQIYTNASESPYEADFAIIQKETEITYKLPSESSIFSIENLAISEEIKLIKIVYIVQITSNSNILILSDSFSVLLALKKPFPRN